DVRQDSQRAQHASGSTRRTVLILIMPRRLSRRDALQLLAAAPSAAAARVSALAQPPAALPVGLFSRHLQWTPVEQAIEVTREVGFDAIGWAGRARGSRRAG